MFVCLKARKKEGDHQWIHHEGECQELLKTLATCHLEAQWYENIALFLDSLSTRTTTLHDPIAYGSECISKYYSLFNNLMCFDITDAKLVAVCTISRIVEESNIRGATEMSDRRRIKKLSGGYNAGREEIFFHKKTLRFCHQRHWDSPSLRRKVSPPLIHHPSIHRLAKLSYLFFDSKNWRNEKICWFFCLL